MIGQILAGGFLLSPFLYSLCTLLIVLSLIIVISVTLSVSLSLSVSRILTLVVTAKKLSVQRFPSLFRLMSRATAIFSGVATTAKFYACRTFPSYRFVLFTPSSGIGYQDENCTPSSSSSRYRYHKTQVGNRYGRSAGYDNALAYFCFNRSFFSSSYPSGYVNLGCYFGEYNRGYATSVNCGIVRRSYARYPYIDIGQSNSASSFQSVRYYSSISSSTNNNSSNNTGENGPVYDVIISGAGPVGLFLACELALAKCSVLILEKAEISHSALKKLPFGMRGLNSLSVESLYRRGLLEQLEIPKRIKEPHATNVKGSQPPKQAGHFAGIPLQTSLIDFSQWKHRLPSATAPILLAEMDELETVLARRAESLGVKIKRGLASSDFEQNEEIVRVSVQSSKGTLSFQGKWLVGCDGSRSAVRKAGGFEFAGTEPEFTGYSALVDILDSEKLLPGRNPTPTGMYLQSQPGYFMIQEFDGGAFHKLGKHITLKDVQEVLRRVSNTDVTLTALHIATTWTDRCRQATTYRNGRVFLAGDAAHIHAPLGGQGLNLGLGDAMNLGWKLAASIQKTAPEGLLDTYYDERYPVGAQVLDWSRAQVAIMRTDSHARAVNAVIRDFMNTRDGATYIAGTLMGIHLHYNLGGNHPLIGYSVPNFEFEGGVRIGELMHQGQGILLDFHMNASLKSLASEYGERIKYVSGRAKEQLGLTTILTRPDGFIVWATDKEPDEQSIRNAIAGWIR